MRNIILSALIAFALGWSACYHLQSFLAPKQTSLESFVYITDKPVGIGKRVHFNGKMWIVTKTTIQNADVWIEVNRAYYSKNPGPRYDQQGKVHIEGPEPYFDGKLNYGVYGVVVD